MESLRKLGLLDADGKPVEDRLSKVLNALLPRFRRRFPAIQDDVEVIEVFEEAARRITKRERASGPIEKLGGYAWKALESIGVSLQRRGSMQVRFNSVDPRSGADIVSQLRAWDASVDEIERGILLRELEAQMTREEAWIFHQKALGFSSEEIARLRGTSVNSVDKAMSRLKQKIHALIAAKE